ncbi:hypothetical protein HY990_04695 [Candidatus Micrarchaeota archaeon]|nr:hypothetical protein [Candidatus Micrarchaeota archaeon]
MNAFVAAHQCTTFASAQRASRNPPNHSGSHHRLRAVTAQEHVSLIVAPTPKSFKSFSRLLKASGVSDSSIRHITNGDDLIAHIVSPRAIPKTVIFAPGIESAIDLTNPDVVAALRRLGTDASPVSLLLLPTDRHTEVIPDLLARCSYDEIGVPLVMRVYPSLAGVSLDSEILDSRLADTQAAMSAFAPIYDEHMIAHNRIAAALNQAVAPQFGHVFVDLGCGSGAQIMEYLKHVVVPGIHSASDRGEPVLPYFVLFVDSNLDMLRLAKAAGQTFFAQVGGGMRRDIHMGFLKHDIAKVNFALLMGELRKLGYSGDIIDCLSASYVKNWVPDVPAFVDAVTASSAKRILVREEDPQSIGLTPSISDEVVSILVQRIRPCDPLFYSSSFTTHGYARVPGAIPALPIDSVHGMYLESFVRI